MWSACARVTLLLGTLAALSVGCGGGNGSASVTATNAEKIEQRMGGYRCIYHNVGVIYECIRSGYVTYVFTCDDRTCVSRDRQVIVRLDE